MFVGRARQASTRGDRGNQSEGYGRDQASGDGRSVLLSRGDGASAPSQPCSCQPLARLRATMSEDMRSWRPLLSTATSKLNTFKGYLASRDPRPLSPASPSTSSQQGNGPSSLGAGPGSGTRQSWTQWAGEKLGRSGQSEGNNANVVEKVSLFPGWAARRLHKPSQGEGTWSLRHRTCCFLERWLKTPISTLRSMWPDSPRGSTIPSLCRGHREHS